MSQSYLLNKEVLINIEQFKEKFESLPLLKLPTETQPAAVGKPGAGEHKIVLNTDLLQSLIRLAEDQNCTISTIFLAAYKILIQRYSAQEDLFITQVGLLEPQE